MPGTTRPITSADRAWVRQQTNGAAGWSDDQLTALIQVWAIPADIDTFEPFEFDFNGEEAEDFDVDDPVVTTNLEPDLWAAAAMVFEYRLLAALEDPRTNASHLRTGDNQLSYSVGASTRLLRSFISRYWRRADPSNRKIARPSGWRTADVHTAKHFRLISSLRWGLSPVVNGPDIPGDVWPGQFLP